DIHELLRQYGEAQLEASGHKDSARDAHSAYFTDFLRAREPDIKGRRQVGALDEIEADLDNIRAAWNRAIEQKNSDAVDRAMDGLVLYLTIRGLCHENDDFFRRAREWWTRKDGEAPLPVGGRLLPRPEHGLPSEDARPRQAERKKSLEIARHYGNRA